MNKRIKICCVLYVCQHDTMSVIVKMCKHVLIKIKSKKNGHIHHRKIKALPLRTINTGKRDGTLLMMKI